MHSHPGVHFLQVQGSRCKVQGGIRSWYLVPGIHYPLFLPSPYEVPDRRTWKHRR